MLINRKKGKKPNVIDRLEKVASQEAYTAYEMELQAALISSIRSLMKIEYAANIMQEDADARGWDSDLNKSWIEIINRLLEAD